jgi:replicative DNA helicase
MKEVPKNRSAEISCLGSILIDQEAMVVVMPILKPSDFFEERHQDIYTAMMSIFNRGESIDQITVAQELNALKKLGEVDITYLSDLITEVPTSLHAEHYARIVKSHSIRRRLVTAGEQIGALAYGETDPNVCMSKADQILLTIQSDMATPHLITPSQLAEIGAIHYGNLRDPQHRVSISTGFEELDFHTGGMFPGDYIILAARAGLGKSQVALQVAEVAGKIVPTLVCPIEMHYKQMMDRLVASRTGVPIRQIRAGGYSDEVTDRIFSQALPSIHESGIYLLALNNDIVDTATVTVSLISTMARHMKMSYGLGLIVVDYIGLLDPIAGDEKRQRSEQIRHISRRLKVMANSLEVPLLAIAQINREPERRSDKRPALSDLSESGGLEQDADAVWLLYRDDYYDSEASTKGEAEFWLAKQRQGKANIKLDLHWQEEFSRYLEIGLPPKLIKKAQQMPEEFT